MTIKQRIDNTKDLSVFTCKGHVSFEDILEVFDTYYSGKINRSIIWDFSMATVSMAGEDVEKLAKYDPRKKHKKDHKTAIVASDEMTRALYELFVLLQDPKAAKTPIRLFDSIADANAWLNV